MNDQLQDLLKRVYEEGVAKANAEAETIISNAKTSADELLSQAKSEAEKIVTAAEKQAADLQKNTESDLAMAANHSLSAVKQKITDLILGKAINAKLSQSFGDAEFVNPIRLEAEFSHRKHHYQRYPKTPPGRILSEISERAV